MDTTRPHEDVCIDANRDNSSKDYYHCACQPGWVALCERIEKLERELMAARNQATVYAQEAHGQGGRGSW